jgi:GWxTD domain-containing protein
MKTRTLLPAIIFLAAARLLVAQTSANFRLNLDAAAYKYDETSSYVECYYSLPRGDLSYGKADGVFTASAIFHLRIVPADASGQTVSKTWRVPVQMQDTVGIGGKMLIGKLSFSLPPGKYTFNLDGFDEQHPTRRDSISIPHQVRGLGIRGAQFSDIEICSSIQKIAPDTTNIFYKNTLEVIPNPPLLFGASLPSVTYYVELYNGGLDKYIIRSEIITSYGKTAISRVQRKSGASAARVEVGSLDVSALPTGSYTLSVNYCDTTGAVAVSQSKQFFVYNPGVVLDVATAQQVASSIALEFATMNEQELDERFAVARYIANGEEKLMWSSMKGTEAKKMFLSKFWTDRDPDPATPNNELYEVFMRRVAAANEQFRTSYRPGWKSDRGRVYIVYGPPDLVQRNNGDSDTKPHETWTYDSLPGVGSADFIFLDQGGYNDYQLIHSTHRNEMQNPNWDRQLKVQ